MTMRAAPDGVAIKPGKPLAFQPGGYHLMIVGLKSAFLPGESVHVTLHFAHAGDIGADLKVEGFGATGPEAESPPPRPAGKQAPAAKEEPPSISY